MGGVELRKRGDELGGNGVCAYLMTQTRVNPNIDRENTERERGGGERERESERESEREIEVCVCVCVCVCARATHTHTHTHTRARTHTHTHTHTQHTLTVSVTLSRRDDPARRFLLIPPPKPVGAFLPSVGTCSEPCDAVDDAAVAPTPAAPTAEDDTVDVSASAPTDVRAPVVLSALVAVGIAPESLSSLSSSDGPNDVTASRGFTDTALATRCLTDNRSTDVAPASLAVITEEEPPTSAVCAKNGDASTEAASACPPTSSVSAASVRWAQRSALATTRADGRGCSRVVGGAPRLKLPMLPSL